MMAPPISTSPLRPQQTARPSSAHMTRSARSNSRLSVSSRPDQVQGPASKASDDDDHTAVRVGKLIPSFTISVNTC